MRFLSPTQGSTISFNYCDENFLNCGEKFTYNPLFPPKIYQTSQIKASASKDMTTPSADIQCRYIVKAAPPIFTPPSTYGGTWTPYVHKQFAPQLNYQGMLLRDRLYFQEGVCGAGGCHHGGCSSNRRILPC